MDHGANVGPNSIELPSPNDSPQPISRKPSPVRRRPPQRPHILNNPNVLVEGEFSSGGGSNGQPVSSNEPIVDQDPFIRTSNGRGTTTLNPFSNYNSVGLSSVADIESTRISSLSPNEPTNHSPPSIHSLADDLESNYNLNSNTDLFNYNNAVGGNTSPVANGQSSSSYSPSVETVSNNELNTTPYITTLTTEKSIIGSSSLNPVTESVVVSSVSSTVQTTTPATPVSSAVTTSSRTRDSSIRDNNNLGNVRRGRPRSGSNTRVDTTPQPIVQPKARVTSAPVTRSPSVTSTSNKQASSGSSSADSEPIVWEPSSNKVTCNRRGVHSHPQSCGQFVVCAPSKGEIKSIVNHCPAQQVFVKEVGRCKPGDRNTCKPFLKA